MTILSSILLLFVYEIFFVTKLFCQNIFQKQNKHTQKFFHNFVLMFIHEIFNVYYVLLFLVKIKLK